MMNERPHLALISYVHFHQLYGWISVQFYSSSVARRSRDGVSLFKEQLERYQPSCPETPVTIADLELMAEVRRRCTITLVRNAERNRLMGFEKRLPTTKS